MHYKSAVSTNSNISFNLSNLLLPCLMGCFFSSFLPFAPTFSYPLQVADFLVLFLSVAVSPHTCVILHMFFCNSFLASASCILTSKHCSFYNNQKMSHFAYPNNGCNSLAYQNSLCIILRFFQSLKFFNQTFIFLLQYIKCLILLQPLPRTYILFLHGLFYFIKYDCSFMQTT